MQTRLADKKDFPVLKKLWMDSFNEKPIFCEKFFDVRAWPDRISLIEDNDEIISALHMLPCYFQCDSELVKGVNLVGAATFEKYRGQKYMESLIAWSIRLMKDRGEVLCSLKPFLHKFYRKYGWESCCRTYKYIFQPEDIERLKRLYGTTDSAVEVIKKIRPRDVVMFNDLYEKYTPPVFLKRSMQDWEFFLWDIFTNNSCAFMNDYGYFICIIEENSVRIIETVFSGERALVGLLDKIAEFYGERLIELNSLSWLDFNNYKSMNKEDFTMMRIIDLLALSGKIPVKGIDLMAGIYEITDNVASWNCGRFFISESDGKLVIEETRGNPDYKFDIGELTGKIFNEANTVVFEGY